MIAGERSRPLKHILRARIVLLSAERSAHCNSCKFFDEHKVNGAQAASDEGLCRFNPPVTQPAPGSKGLWPVVANTDWCGHFAPEMSAAE